MIETRTIGDWIADIIIYLLLILLALLMIYPLIFVLFASVSNPTIIMMKQYGVLIRPIGFQLEAYKFVLKNEKIKVGYLNTLIYVIAGVGISMFLTFLGAYVLSRAKYCLKKFYTFMFILTMYFSGGLIPFFLVVKNLGWIDTRWALLFPYALSTYNMIIMRTAFVSIPKGLEESAIIDGANDYIILLRICIPLSIPTIAVIGLFYAVDKWNAWFHAMIFLRSYKLYPLQLALREILITSNAEYMAEMGNSIELTAISELIKYATIIVATVPILLVYPFIQRYFVKGVMIGAIKG